MLILRIKYRKMTPKFHPLVIKDIRRETDECVSIAFEIPQELIAEYTFKPGQYLSLKTIIEGEEIRRSYSLCSSPFENEWRVAVKQVDNGRFSSFANTSLKVNDILEVMTPMGNFTVDLDEKNTKEYVLVAVGSGITPIISLAKEILMKEPNSNVTLFYGNRGFGSIIFREQIEALKNKYIENFRVVHVLSRESLGNTIQKGRINAEKFQTLLNAFLKGTAIDEVFVCGPEEMVLDVKKVCLENNVSEKNVHFELFGTNIVKKTDDNQPQIQSNIRVILDGDVFDLSMESGQNVLDAAIAAGADLPFSCKGGVCCTCKAKILEGNARMDVNYALDADEVANGYILTCQAHPTTEKLIVSFDD